MGLRKRLINVLEPSGAGHVIRDVRMGLGYTAARLEDGRTCLAYTMQRQRLDRCSVFGGALPLFGKRVEELLHSLGSANPLAITAGLATANAISNVLPPRRWGRRRFVGNRAVPYGCGWDGGMLRIDSQSV
ncbi:MAG: enolase N-terminal-like fold-containing protein [Thermodesulfobacteriota bacterium]